MKKKNDVLDWELRQAKQAIPRLKAAGLYTPDLTPKECTRLDAILKKNSIVWQAVLRLREDTPVQDDGFDSPAVIWPEFYEQAIAALPEADKAILRKHVLAGRA